MTSMTATEIGAVVTASVAVSGPFVAGCAFLIRIVSEQRDLKNEVLHLKSDVLELQTSQKVQDNHQDERFNRLEMMMATNHTETMGAVSKLDVRIARIEGPQR